MDLSLVIPSYNEAESLPELFAQIEAVLEPRNISHEIIIIDDGSTDNSFDVLKSLKSDYPALKALRFRRNYGKSAALSVGFKAAKGKYVITMDADLQDDPNEIPRLIEKLESGYDLVSGWKKKRHDPIGKRLPSKIYNGVASLLSGIKLHDFNCGLKAYRNEVVKSLLVYGELHRSLPIQAHWQGFRVTEMVVQHRPRKYGNSKYGLWRFVSGFLDLTTVLFLTRFRTSPLHVFGILGAGSFGLGFMIEVYFTFLKLLGKSIGNRPLFFLGILLIIVGIQFICFGLVAEMLSAGFSDNVEYSISESID